MCFPLRQAIQNKNSGTTGWHREISPQGIFDKQAQIHSLGSRILYHVNQGIVEPGETITEQLATLGIVPNQLDYVLLTHLDCDHANGLQQVADAKHILVAEDELRFANHTPVRYQKRWWQGVSMNTFTWNGSDGPAENSYDLFGDESIQLINIPGHSDGLFAVKVRGENGKFVLLTSDGAYATKSWEQLILPGIAANRDLQRASLTWIQKQSQLPDCYMAIANHDPEIQPQIIDFYDAIIRKNGSCG